MTGKRAYLKAMGIDVWVEREPSQPVSIHHHEVNDTSAEIEAGASPANIAISEKITKPEVEHKENDAAVSELGMPQLASQVSGCQACELSKLRKQAVFGQGDKNAALMIIGDMPTEEDDALGHAFSGEAGALLTAMLKAMGYQREQVYLTNIVKCRTEQKQEPGNESATSCEPYLLRQIKLVQPKLILALGNFAAQRLLKSKSTMTRLRGQFHYVEGISAPVLVTYHPAYLLQAANEKRKAWEDLQMAMKELGLSTNHSES